ALASNETSGQGIIGDQGQGGIVGSNTGVEQTAAAGLQSQGAAVAAGVDDDRVINGDVVAGLEDDGGAGVQGAGQEIGRKGHRLGLAAGIAKLVGIGQAYREPAAAFGHERS